MAALTVGRLKDTAAVDSLLDALRDNDPDIRWRAAWVLGQIHNMRAVNPLMKPLDDSYGNVRWSAAEALEQLATKKLLNPRATAKRSLRRNNYTIGCGGFPGEDRGPRSGNSPRSSHFTGRVRSHSRNRTKRVGALKKERVKIRSNMRLQAENRSEIGRNSNNPFLKKNCLAHLYT